MLKNTNRQWIRQHFDKKAINMVWYPRKKKTIIPDNTRLSYYHLLKRIQFLILYYIFTYNTERKTLPAVIFLKIMLPALKLFFFLFDIIYQSMNWIWEYCCHPLRRLISLPLQLSMSITLYSFGWLIIQRILFYRKF